MSKIKISFDNQKYTVDKSVISSAIEGLKTHLTTAMNGTGASIKVEKTSYDVDAVMLSSAINNVVSHFETIDGDGLKIIVDGVEYNINPVKLNDAIAKLHTVLGDLGDIEGVEIIESIVWDGNTEGLSSVILDDSNVFYKVSSTMFSNEQIKSMSYSSYNTLENKASTFQINEDWDAMVQGGYVTDDVCNVYNKIIVVRKPGAIDSISGMTFQETGVYFVYSIYVDDGGYYVTSLHMDNDSEDPGLVPSLAPGLYQTDSENIITTWDDLISMGVLNSNGVIVSGQEANLVGDLVLPNTLTSVPRNAYKNCTDITGVIIPEGVKTIDAYAFQGCTNLRNIEISDSVSSIGTSAFQNCTGLTSVEIPDAVTTISPNVFNGCSNLTSITFGTNSQLSTIGSYAFKYCTGLTEIIVPDSVTSIGDKAFEDCTNLASVVIPDGATTIGNWAFQGCTSLATVTFGENSQLTSIGISAFSGCTSLETMTIPFVGATKDGTENTHFGYIFGADSYSSNELYVPASLKSVTITGGSTIDNYAFYGCTNLQSLVIKNRDIILGDNLLLGCQALTNITIGDKIFSLTSSQTSGIDWMSFTLFDADDNGSYQLGFEVSFGAKYELIGWYADDTLISTESHFEYLASESITFVADIAFSEYGLFDAKDNLVASWNKLVNTYGMDVTKDYSFPTFTSDTAALCYILTNNSELGSATKLAIPASVTTIGAYAFGSCRSLKSVVISEGTTTINGSAFYNGWNLGTVYYEGTMEQWCNISFANSSANPCCNGADLYIDDVKQESITIPSTVTEIKQYAFYKCKSLASIEIPASVTTIGRSAFSNCKSLANVTFDENSRLTTINESTFSGCTSLTTVIFGENSQLTTIAGNYDNGAFYGCTNLESIEIPDSVTSIGTEAFQGCTKLATVTFGENSQLATIGDHAFEDCTSLTSIEIPASVTTIGAYAFRGCTSLTSVDIPDNVTFISGYVFSGCTSLNTITFEGTVDQWNAIEKDGNWNKNAPETSVTCSDGSVAL